MRSCCAGGSRAALPPHHTPLPCHRINRYAGCSPECFVLALVYIDRLIARNGLALTSLNVHRVIITAVMLAAKFFDDQYYNNAYYAKVGGIPCVEINALELEMLFSCGFSLAVTSDVFERYFSELAGHCLAAPLDCPCDCPRSGSLLSFGPEELRYTGLRSDLVSGAVAAAAAAATVAAAAAAMGEGAGGGVPAAAGGRGAGAGRSPSDVVFSDVGDDVVTPPEPVTPEE